MRPFVFARHATGFGPLVRFRIVTTLLSVLIDHIAIRLVIFHLPILMSTRT